MTLAFKGEEEHAGKKVDSEQEEQKSEPNNYHADLFPVSV